MPESSFLATQRDDESVQGRRVAYLRIAIQALFGLFIIMALATHSSHWRVGPFTWLPLVRLPSLIPALVLHTTDPSPMSIGVLTLIPVLLGLGWPVLRLVELRQPAWRRRWQWGWRHFTGPLLGLTALGIGSLVLSGLFGQGLAATAAGDSLPLRNTAFQLLSLGVAWFVYLFMVNERPRLTWALAVVVIIQGGVGVAQFAFQHDLGLAAWGELALDPEVRGVSVLLTGEGQRWLRAYGLTGHPNLLAALLAVLLLLLLRDLPQQVGWRRLLLAAAVGIGALGLLASVSRAAWLAFAIGLGVWTLGLWMNARATPSTQILPTRTSARRVLLWLFVPLAASLAFVTRYGSQLATRFLDLDTAIEARSLIERTRDLRIASMLIRDHPWTGVGLGNYLPNAKLLDRSARVVHNVPLLVTAEMGILGGLLWLWLGVAPIGTAFRAWRYGRRNLLPQLAPWIALLTIGMFHGLPWINTGWRTTILLALLMGDWVIVLMEARSGQQAGPQLSAEL